MKFWQNLKSKVIGTEQPSSETPDTRAPENVVGPRSTAAVPKPGEPLNQVGRAWDASLPPSRSNPSISVKSPQSNNYANRPIASPSPGGEGWGEGELNISGPPSAQTDPDTVSTFEHFNESTSPYNRNGKIARLPRPLRERINQALYQHFPGVKIVDELNKMPEVKAVLAEHFGGRPIIPQNIYEWKNGGYRDWLHRRQILDQKRELAADAQDLADTAPEIADSLFGLLTIDYAHLMMNRDKKEPEQFEKKRKALSTLSQDIVRLYRCRLNARRVQIQETKLDNETEKTEEQLLLKFREWTDNPEVRKALILAPMEADRRMRILSDLPPAPEDPLVQRETENDPYFGHFDENQTKNKPIQTKNSDPQPNPPSQPDTENILDAQAPEESAHTSSGGAADSGGASVPVSRSNPSITSETAPESHGHANRPNASPSPGGEGRGEGELEINTDSNVRPVSFVPSQSDDTADSPSSTLQPSPTSNLDYSGKSTQELIAEAEDNYARQKADRLSRSSNDTLSQRERDRVRENYSNENPDPQPKPKRELSPYEKALLEGKTHEEAIYAQFAPVEKPDALRPALHSSWGEGICDHFDAPLPDQSQPPPRPYNLRPPLGYPIG
jgi:hypothetical protein